MKSKRIAVVCLFSVFFGGASPLAGQQSDPPNPEMRIGVEPLVGVGKFAGAGAFDSNVNIRPAPVYGGRLTVKSARFEPFSFYAEYIRSTPEQVPPKGCSNDSCAQLRGETLLTFWSLGGEKTWPLSASKRGLFAHLSAGLGWERLETQHDSLSSGSMSQIAVALGGAGEYRMAQRAAVRLSLTDYVSLVHTEYYSMGINSHLAARVSVRIFP